MDLHQKMSILTEKIDEASRMMTDLIAAVESTGEEDSLMEKVLEAKMGLVRALKNMTMAGEAGSL